MEPAGRFSDLVTGTLSEAGGMRLEHADSLTDALRVLATDEIDVVIADLALPDSPGPATAQLLRSAAPEVPVIILSAQDDLGVALQTIRGGADEYVVKSTFSVDSLAWLVRLVFERNRRLTGEEAGLSLLQAVGRHLLDLADRADVYVGVVFVGLQPAVDGRFADADLLVDAVSEVLQRTLHRCDLLSQLRPGELAVVLISDRPLDVHKSVERLVDALATCAAGARARIGYAAYDSTHPVPIGALVEQARGAP